MYTVLMASRPDERYVLEAIRSIVEQTHPPESVVLIINGPEARTSHLGESVIAAFPVVDVLTIDAPGMIQAVEVGLDTVTTPYVALLDADDLWAPEKQQRQLALLEADRSLDAVSCEAVNFTVAPDGTRVEGTAAVTRMFSAVTFRTDAFEQFGRPDPSASHFAWLVRWWTHAQERGIRTAGIEYRGLWRRVHATNGWVTDRSAGRAHLLGELRRIHRARGGDLAGRAVE